MNKAVSLAVRIGQPWRDAGRIAKICYEMLGDQRITFVWFVILSLILALTEGFSISLLLPILDAQNSGGSFKNIPFMGDITAQFSSFNQSKRIESAAAILAITVTIRGVLQYSVAVMGALIPQKLHHRFSMQSYESLMGVAMGWVQNHNVGTLISGLGEWQQRAAMLISNIAIVISAFCLLLIYSGMMLILSWPLTVGALVFLLIISVLSRFFTYTKMRQAGRAHTESISLVSDIVHQSLVGIKQIRLSAGETTMISLFNQALTRMLGAERRSVFIGNISSPLITTLAGLFICGVVIFSAASNQSNSTSWIGQLLMFLLLLSRLLSPVALINTTRGRITKDLHAFEMMRKMYHDTAAAKELSGTIHFKGLHNSMVFDSVSFNYDETDKPVILNLTTTIQQGQMVAIVGPSGAGKSTLIALISRLFDPTQGRILVDDVDLRDLDVRTWRRRISVVSQDIFIFNDSVYDNIRFGCPEASLDDVERAAKLASAHDFIIELPRGYETKLGDRGVRLSGGQQQRIAIARAILCDPEILILDEATSHLDTVTEQSIQRAVEKLSKDRTIIIIAHRLSTVSRADKVIVLKNGVIVEEGTHNQLLENAGTYAELVAQQAFTPSINADDSA